MANKVISFSDKAYFKFGKPFLLTRHKVDAEFVVYSPDLSEDQIAVLKQHDIEHKHIDKDIFENKMQFLKFDVLKKEISYDGGGTTFVDFDTFFNKDWNKIFANDFDLGITVRNNCIKTRLLRAFSNGGVIFCKNSKKSYELCDFAIKTMENGGDDSLPEYDTIYRTLEENRPKHKTWKRENLRWWVDQVFLSSLVLKYFRLTKKYRSVKDIAIYKFGEYNIGLFNCDTYNYVDPNLKDYGRKDVYIYHLKNKGRDIVESFCKEIRKCQKRKS
jgi:hypothetical protein